MRSKSCTFSSTTIYIIRITDFDPKGTISKIRVHARLSLDIMDSDRSPNAAYSTRISPDRWITQVKLKKTS